MKSKIIITICVFALLIIINCRDNASPENTRVINYPRSLVMVLCDLTTSIDSTRTIDKAFNNVNKVLMSLQPNTKYMVYPLGQNPEQCLFEGETGNDLTATDITSSNRENYDNCLRKLQQEYKKRNDRATCINEALEAAANTLRNLQQRNIYKQITLVIVSDMLEACTVNGVPLNFEKQPFDQQKANLVLKNWPENRKYLAGLDSVNIYILYNTSKLVSFSLISDFWKSAFEKAGFHKEVHPETNFQPEYLQAADKKTALSLRND